MTERGDKLKALMRRTRGRTGSAMRSAFTRHRRLSWRSIWPGLRRVVFRRRSPRQFLAALLALVAAGGIVFGLGRTEMDTGTDSFLPTGDPALKAVEQKARSFGGDPVVVLLKSKEQRQLLLDDKQLLSLLKMEGKLSRTSNVAAVHGPATMLNQIAGSAQNLLAQIGGRRDAIRNEAEDEARKDGKSGKEARAAAKEATARFDARYGSLLVKGLPSGMPTLSNPAFVRRVVFDAQNGSVRPQWNFVVPDPNTIAVSVRPRENLDQAGTQKMVSSIRATVNNAGLPLSDVTVSGVPAVTAGLSEEVTDELPLLGSIVALAVALRFLLFPVGFRLRHRLWPLAAAVVGTAATVAVFGLTGRPLSFGAVAFLPILLGVGSSIPLYLAVLRDTRRVVAVSVASAAGFASLAVSPLPFVKELGIALAGGVLLTVVAAVIMRRGFVQHGDGDPPEPSRPVRGSTSTASRAKRTVVALVVAATAASGWLVLPKLPVQANPQELAKGVSELEEAREAQEVLGSSGEVSISLEGHNVDGPEAYAWAQKAERTLITKFGDQLRPVVTLPDILKFLGERPSAGEIHSAMELLPRYLTSAVINPGADSSVMVFGLKLQDLGRQAELLDEVRHELPPPPAGLKTDVVGLPVAAERGYELISDGRYLANLIGIGVAGAVLLVGLRRRGDAIRAMAAAGLATGWSLAGIWLLDGALSPLTVALGSLTTVTGCEFLVLLADSEVRGSDRLRRSVGFACLTSAIGYCALAASDLSVLRDFGLVLTGTVVLSYVAARTVLWLAPPSDPAVPVHVSDNPVPKKEKDRESEPVLAAGDY